MHAAYSHCRFSLCAALAIGIAIATSASAASAVDLLQPKGALRIWGALSPEAKVNGLDQMLRRAVDEATTAAVAD